MPQQKILESRVALVTGASRGIGAAAAKALAAAGAHVILLARTEGALAEVDDAIQAAGGRATLMPFDLGENKKISAIGPAIAERFGRLDILVAAAGMLGNLSPAGMMDVKVHDEVFRVNYAANLHLVGALDPLLRGSDAGRAIFVTDAQAKRAAPFWGAYAASKAALEAMAQAYAAEVAYSPLRVNILDPGPVATDLRAAAFPAEDPKTLRRPDDVADVFVRLAAPACTETGQRIAA